MSTAAALVGSTALRDRRPQIVAGIASLLLHGLLVWWLLWTPLPRDRPPEEPQTLVIEVVAAPTPPAPPVEPPVAVVPPPPPPQPSEAPIAEQSTPPSPPPPRPAPPATRPRTESATPSPRSSPALPRTESGQPAPPAEAGGGTPRYATATRTVQDVVLTQVLQHWIIDYRAPKFEGIEIGWRFTLLPDGTLGPPFGRNDPWDPRRMIRDYDTLLKPGNEAVRTALETFIQAARQAQPFRLPPDGKADEPRFLPLEFRLGNH